MTNLHAQEFLIKHGIGKVTDIIKNAHHEAVYYVDEWTNNFGGIHGYYTDRFIVGIHNRKTHFKLDDFRKLIK